jgi:hypothetical protein
MLVAPASVCEPLGRLLASLLSGELHGAVKLLGLRDERALDLYRLVGFRSAHLANPATRYVSPDFDRFVDAARVASRAAAADLARALAAPDLDEALLGELAAVAWPPASGRTTGESEDPATTQARAQILDAVARHPATKLDVLERLLQSDLVTGDAVRENPALVLLGLEPYEKLVTWPTVARLAPLPPRLALRIEIVDRASQPLTAATWLDGAVPWQELLARLDDADLVHEALWSGVRDPDARAQVPLHAWLTLTLEPTALARSIFVRWLVTGEYAAAVRRYSAFPPTRPNFADPEELGRAAARVLELRPDLTSVTRLGDAFAELIDRTEPESERARRHDRFVRTVVERWLAVAGTDDPSLEARFVTPSLASPAVLSTVIASLRIRFDVPPSRRAAIVLSKGLLAWRGEGLSREATAILGRWARQEV